MAINYSKINWDVAPYKYANPSNMATMDNGIKSACDFADANEKNALGETSGGRNLWDEVWEFGGFNPDGTKNTGFTDRFRSANLIKVKPNTTYHLVFPSGTYYICTYNSSKVGIARTSYSAVTNITTDSSTYYLAFMVIASVYANNIAIIEGTSGSYEPYYESNKMLTEDVAEIASLKYLGWTVPREMPIKNYVDSNGTFHQRVGRVDLGTLSWSMYSNKTNSFIAYNVSSSANAYNNKYQKLSGFGDLDVKTGIIYNSNYNQLIVSDLSYADATAFRNSLSGVYLYYELSSEVQIGEGNEIVPKLNSKLANTLPMYQVTMSTSYASASLQDIESVLLPFSKTKYKGSGVINVTCTDGSGATFVYNNVDGYAMFDETSWYSNNVRKFQCSANSWTVYRVNTTVVS